MSVLVILMAMATSPDDDDVAGDGDDVEEMEIIAMVIESLDRHTGQRNERIGRAG